MRAEEKKEGVGRMAFRERSGEDMIITITLEGVILQQEAATMQRIFNAVLITEFTKLILDLSDVLTISQRGIEALLGFRSKSKKQGRELEIHGIHPIVRRTLEEQGVDKAFIIR